MHIGGNNGSLNDTIAGNRPRCHPFGSSVANARNDATKRTRVGPKNRSTTVVFKTGHWLVQSFKKGFTDKLANCTMPLRVRGDIKNAKAFDSLATRIAIPVPQNLQRGADGKKWLASVQGVKQARVIAEFLSRQ